MPSRPSPPPKNYERKNTKNTMKNILFYRITDVLSLRGLTNLKTLDPRSNPITDKKPRLAGCARFCRNNLLFSKSNPMLLVSLYTSIPVHVKRLHDTRGILS